MASVSIGTLATIPGYEGTGADAATEAPRFADGLKAALTEAGYPAAADPARINKPMVIAILSLWVIVRPRTVGMLAP